MKKSLLLSLIAIAVLITAMIGPALIPAVQAYSGIPTISITSVEKDSKVTIQTHNFPAHVKFTVLMGKIGTQGIGGTEVTTTDSGSGGSFSATYNIPSGLKGQKQIAIRLENKTTGYYAYDWFWNSTSTSTTTTPTPTPKPGGYSGYPTFSISSVVVGSKVTIKTNNFPKNDTFTVTIGKYGTKGVGGTVVTTTDSGSGGVFTVTYDIPSGLKNETLLAIRLESKTSGYYAYNWFFNIALPSGGTIPVTGYTGYPTFSISAVVKDTSVTIKGTNFPANDDFTVTMGKYGTKGIGGVVITTQNSGSGGALSATYNVPASLKGETRIAIRLQSKTSGYYAYNWFWNNSTP